MTVQSENLQFKINFFLFQCSAPCREQFDDIKACKKSCVASDDRETCEDSCHYLQRIYQEKPGACPSVSNQSNYVSFEIQSPPSFQILGSNSQVNIPYSNTLLELIRLVRNSNTFKYFRGYFKKVPGQIQVQVGLADKPIFFKSNRCLITCCVLVGTIGTQKDMRLKIWEFSTRNLGNRVLRNQRFWSKSRDFFFQNLEIRAVQNWIEIRLNSEILANNYFLFIFLENGHYCRKKLAGSSTGI